MNALIRKEIRQLLPVWSIAMLLAFSVWLLPKHDHSMTGLDTALFFLPFVACPALVLMISLDSFGREFSAGTFSILLAQPIPRSRLWWIKSLTLAAALIMIVIVWWGSYLLHRPFGFKAEGTDLRQMLLSTGIVVLAAYCGGLWSVLLFRQVAAAFWFTVLIPPALIVCVINPLHSKYQQQSDGMIIAVFAVYGIISFIFARWLFLRAQDTQWTGGIIALPSRRRELARSTNVVQVGRKRHFLRALIGKEIQLHQSQLIIAGALLLFHLAVIATRRLGGGLKEYPALEFVLSQFWMLWLVLPFLVGCAAVAEERKLGTLEGQLCLPARRSVQFAVKLCVVVGLSLAFGVLMPLVIEGKGILPSARDLTHGLVERVDGIRGPILEIPAWESKALALLKSWLAVLLLSMIAMTTGFMAFFASTFTRSTLQALAPAIVSIVVALFLRDMSFLPEEYVRYPLWRGCLIYPIAVPVLATVLIGLMYWNFKRVLVGFHVWRRNALVLLTAVAFVVLSTTAIYHRFWEYLSAKEPPHDVARLDRLKRVQSTYSRMLVELPDGRFWANGFSVSRKPTHIWNLGTPVEVTLPPKGTFLEGTNWADVALSYWLVGGVKTDGSLWVSSQKRPNELQGMVRLGDKNDWRSVAGPLELFALKTNGTLWRLSAQSSVTGSDRAAASNGAVAVQLGEGSDWIEIESSGHHTFLEKADGSIWMYPAAPALKGYQETNLITLNRMIRLSRIPDSGEPQSGNVFRTAVNSRGMSEFRISESGILYFERVEIRSSGDHSTTFERAEKIQLGTETNWVAIAEGGRLITLKRNGSLWKWHFPENLRDYPERAHATLFSKHRDWIGLASLSGSGVVGVAADGSFWLWSFDEKHMHRVQYSDGILRLPPLLAASRKPQRIGNIFDAD